MVQRTMMSFNIIPASPIKYAQNQKRERRKTVPNFLPKFRGEENKIAAGKTGAESWNGTKPEANLKLLSL
ncbi:hypothetical protein L484_022200 [Morus notabilis]|uniref:Uncharacterized protein n=1 Tax=Morus notabilis TaxID=981085 RepID=W9RNF9_9ROSA|nr:hypothetical protein L484_022200 [Morus notabilis]